MPLEYQDAGTQKTPAKGGGLTYEDEPKASGASTATGQTSAQPEPSLWNSDIAVPGPAGVGVMTVNPSHVFQTVKNLGLEGGGATAGQAVGALGGPLDELTIPLGGFIGGAAGNALAQATTPGKDFSFGEVLGAGTAGAIPGASLAKAGAMPVAIQAGKMALGNVAATNVQSLVEGKGLAPIERDVLAAGAGAGGTVMGKYLDNGLRASSSATARSQDSLRRETLNAGRELGLVVPPAVIRPGPMNNTLQSMAGKAATAQEAVLRNQPKINAAVRAEIGLPADAPLTPISLNTARTGPNLVYGEVAQLTPATGSILQNFKTATAEANMARQAYRASIESGRRNPALLQEAVAQETIANQMQSALEKEASGVKGGLDVMKRFEEARTRLAQIGLAERAVNKGSGEIDAKVIGDALEHGEKLTGSFAKIGKFQNAFGKYVQDAATTPPSGVDFLKMYSRLGLGGAGGYALGGPAGAIAGVTGAAAAEKGARSVILSPFYQRNFAQPNYGSSLEDVPASLVRLGAASEGRKSPNTKSNKTIFDHILNATPLPN